MNNKNIFTSVIKSCCSEIDSFKVKLKPEHTIQIHLNNGLMFSHGTNAVFGIEDCLLIKETINEEIIKRHIMWDNIGSITVIVPSKRIV